LGHILDIWVWWGHSPPSNCYIWVLYGMIWIYKWIPKRHVEIRPCAHDKLTILMRWNWLQLFIAKEASFKKGCHLVFIHPPPLDPWRLFNVSRIDTCNSHSISFLIWRFLYVS
jgi:hypothetical protein